MGKIWFGVGMFLFAAAATAAPRPLGTAAIPDGWANVPPDQLCNYCEDAVRAPDAIRTSYRVGAGHARGSAPEASSVPPAGN